MRHDHAVIKNIHKIYGDYFAKSVQSMPFFYVSDDVERHFCSPKHLNAQGHMRQYPEYQVDLMDFEEIDRLMPFPMINVMDHDIGWHNIDWHGNGQWKIMICMDVMLEHIGVPIPPGTLIGVEVEFHGKVDETTYDAAASTSLLVDQTTNRIPGMSLEWQNKFSEMLDMDRFRVDIVKHLTAGLHYFMSFLKWAQTQHLVEAKPANPKNGLGTKTAVRKPWLRDDLTHYIYLDAPQRVTDSQPRNGDPTYTVRGHHRRGHVRRLANPRFRNHPMYGKYIPVRASWVGSKEWTVNGTIYTVKGDIDED